MQGGFLNGKILMMRRIFLAFCRRLQRLKAYRVLMRRLIRRRINYRVATAEDAYVCSRFYRYDKIIKDGDPVECFARLLKSLTGWGYVLVASVRGKIVGSAIIQQFPDSVDFYRDWWVFNMSVNPFYRRLGIAEGLMQVALRKLTQEGGAKANLFVHKHNDAAISFYRKMGFQQTSIPGLDASLEKEVQKGSRRRIIMSLSLTENQESDQP